MHESHQTTEKDVRFSCFKSKCFLLFFLFLNKILPICQIWEGKKLILSGFGRGVLWGQLKCVFIWSMNVVLCCSTGTTEKNVEVCCTSAQKNNMWQPKKTCKSKKNLLSFQVLVSLLSRVKFHSAWRRWKRDDGFHIQQIAANDGSPEQEKQRENTHWVPLPRGVKTPSTQLCGKEQKISYFRCFFPKCSRRNWSHRQV